MHRSRAPKYSRIPQEVLFDSRLSAYDRLVYAALSYQCFQGTVAIIGKDTIAAKLGISRRQVIISMAKLIETGHIVASGDRIGRGVQPYHLTSPVFGQKQRSGEVREVVSAPSGGRRLASIRTA